MSGFAEATTEEARAALLEAGRLLFARSCDFFFGAQKLEQVPPPGLPEIAFCGRSNVGKSSLLNALTGRNALARVSNTPGRTRQLNFFNLGERLVLVDMPGYGYAKASKELQADWQGMMFEYLRGRPNLRRVLLLMDARIETKSADIAAMKLLDEAAVAFQIVLTNLLDNASRYSDPVTPIVATVTLAESKGHMGLHICVSNTPGLAGGHGQHHAEQRGQ